MNMVIYLKNKFYVIYDINDNLITTFENYKELAKWFGKNSRSLQSSVTYFNKGKIKSIKNNLDNKLYKIYKMKEDEYDE